MKSLPSSAGSTSKNAPFSTIDGFTCSASRSRAGHGSEQTVSTENVVFWRWSAEKDCKADVSARSGMLRGRR